MKTIVTHGGSFHSDDAFAVATLQLVYGVGEVTVVRSRDEAVIAAADIVVDVGSIYDVKRKRFDHHQPGAPTRENGMPYAAFGLVWQTYGEVVSGSNEIALEIERTIVIPIDAGDTGVSLYALTDPNQKPFELYQVIRSFLPVWGSDASKDEAFLKAVDFARELLVRLIAAKVADVDMKAIIKQVYKVTPDKHILVFDVPVSSIACIEYPEVNVVVMPDNPEINENWTAATVRKGYGSFEARVNFPESWCGLRDTELAAVSGVEDAVFCHKAGFIFVARSREGALQAAAGAG